MPYYAMVILVVALGAVGASILPRHTQSETAVNWCEVRRLENENCSTELLTPEEAARCNAQMAREGVRIKAGIPTPCLDKNTKRVTKVSE